MATNEAEPPAPGADSWAAHELLPRQSITGIPKWVLLVVPFGLVVLVVGVGFIIAGATQIDGGPGFATPTPRVPASQVSSP